NDIFLDGNTFEDSHNVDKETFVGDFVLGANLIYGRWKLSYSHVLRTKEFVGQDDSQKFGSVTLSYTFGSSVHGDPRESRSVVAERAQHPRARGGFRRRDEVDGAGVRGHGEVLGGRLARPLGMAVKDPEQLFPVLAHAPHGIDL